MQRFFITGSDTNIGKTYITQGLLTLFNIKGYSTIGIKPVASGCESIEGKLYNQDALTLQKTASILLPYDKVNPICFLPPIAPHLGAQGLHQRLTVNAIVKQCQFALSTAADICLIEGIGGWAVPLNQHETTADLPKALASNVILVVGMRLGCLNHALLTYEAIIHKQCHLAGWVANCIENDMIYLSENIATLSKRIKAPLLGIIPFHAAPENHLALNLLFDK